MLKLKSQKGSITLFVLLAMILFLVVILSVYIYSKNKEIVLKNQTDEIIQEYNKDVKNANQIYENAITDNE